MIRRGIRHRGAWTGLAALLLAAGSARPACAQTDEGGAPAFHGTWQMQAGELEVDGMEWVGEFRLQALDDRRLRVEWTGHYAYKTSMGPNANFGDIAIDALVNGDKVAFKDPYGHCYFFLRLRGKVIEAAQTGSGCFGMRVTASGTYGRVP